MRRIAAFFLAVMMVFQVLPAVSAAESYLRVISYEEEHDVYLTVHCIVDGVMSTEFVLNGLLVSELPTPPDIPGKIFRGWDVDGATAVTDGMVLTAVLEDVSDEASGLSVQPEGTKIRDRLTAAGVEISALDKQFPEGLKAVFTAADTTNAYLDAIHALAEKIPQQTGDTASEENSLKNRGTQTLRRGAEENGTVPDEDGQTDGPEAGSSDSENETATPIHGTVTGYTTFDLSVETEDGEAYRTEGSYTVRVELDLDVQSLLPDESEISQVTYTLYHIKEQPAGDQEGDGSGDSSSFMAEELEVSAEEDRVFTFTTTGFSPYVLQYTVDFVYGPARTVISLDFADCAELSGIDRIGQTITVNLPDCLSDLQTEEHAGLQLVSQSDRVSIADYTAAFFTAAALSISGQGVEYEEGQIRLPVNLDEATVTLADSSRILVVNMVNMEKAEERTYRFLNSSVALSDIMAEVGIEKYSFLSVSDETCVAYEDGILTALAFFDRIILEVALEDGNTTHVILLNPAPIPAGMTVETENGSLIADQPLPAGTRMTVEKVTDVAEEIRRAVADAMAEAFDEEAEDPVFLQIALYGADGTDVIETSASVTANVHLPLPQQEGKFTSVKQLKVFRVTEDGAVETLDAKYTYGEDEISSIRFDTTGFGLFAVVCTTAYVDAGSSAVIYLNFIGFEPYPEAGSDAVFLYDPNHCDIRVSLEDVLSAAWNKTPSRDGVAVYGKADDLLPDLTRLSTVTAEGDITCTDGQLIIRSDGSIAMSDGEKTLYIVLSGITHVCEEILRTEGATIQVEEGNIPLGSEAKYTFHTDEETEELVDTYDLHDLNAAGYQSADLKIVLNEEEVAAEGLFRIRLSKAGLIPTGMRLGKLYHIHDGKAEELDVTETEDGELEFIVANFSDIVASYTVDFEYNGYSFSMPGGGTLLLSELFAALGIDDDAAQIVPVEFTDPRLLPVEPYG